MLGFRLQEAELQRVQKVRELELVYARAQLELEVSKAQQLAEVEVKKFKLMTEALGPSTIRDLAVAGPEMQVSVQGYVCVCWDHTWNQEGRAGEANTSRDAGDRGVTELSCILCPDLYHLSMVSHRALY